MTKIVIKIISIVDTTIEKGKKDVCWSFLYYWELCVVIDNTNEPDCCCNDLTSLMERFYIVDGIILFCIPEVI